MEKEKLKIEAYETGVSALPDYPSDEGYTAEMLKSVFDARSNKEIKEKHNALTDAAAEIEEALRAHCEDKTNPHGVTAAQAGVEKTYGIKVKLATEDLSMIIPEKDEVYLVRYENLPYKNETGEVKNSENIFYVLKVGDGENSLSKLSPTQSILSGEGEGSLIQLVETEAMGYEIDGIYYCPRSRAEGYAAVSLGRYNRASGKNSMAVNYNNEVLAKDGFAANSGNHIAEEAEGAFVAGHGNKASREYQTVVGTYNSENPDAIFVVGAGISEENRRNVLEIDGKGNLNINGADGNGGEITVDFLHVISSGVFEYVSASQVNTGSYIGNGNMQVAGSSRFGNANISGQSAHAEMCNATGIGSAAFNRNNKVLGKFSFAVLSSNTIPENLESVFIAGHANTAVASHQAIFGTYANPETSDAFVIGNGSSAGKKNAFAVGKNGSIRIGGTEIAFGSTVFSEAEMKKLKEIDSLQRRIEVLEAALTAQNTASEGVGE